MRSLVTTLAVACLSTTLMADSYVAGVGTVNFDPNNPFGVDPTDSYISALTIDGTVNGGRAFLIDPIAGALSDFGVSVVLADADPTDNLREVTWSLFTTNNRSLYDGLNPLVLNPLPSGADPNFLAFSVGDPFGLVGIPNSGVDLGADFVRTVGDTIVTYTRLDGSTYDEVSFGNDSPNPPGWPRNEWFRTFFLDLGTAEDVTGFVVNQVVEVVPSPGVLALLGVAGLAGRRRRD